MSATPFRKKDKSLSELMVKGRISTFTGSAAEILLTTPKEKKMMVIIKKIAISFILLNFVLLPVNSIPT
jgi:hypothetical protein